MRFTDAKVILDEVAERTGHNAQRITNGIELLQKALDDLSSMQTEYSGVSADIDADAAANPNDEGWQNAKAEKDNLVTDFQALRTDATALKAAVDAVTRTY